MVCYPGPDRFLDGEMSHRVCPPRSLPLLIWSVIESRPIVVSLMDSTGPTSGRSPAPVIPQPNPAIINTATTHLMNNVCCLRMMESGGTKRAA